MYGNSAAQRISNKNEKKKKNIDKNITRFYSEMQTNNSMNSNRCGKCSELNSCVDTDYVNEMDDIFIEPGNYTALVTWFKTIRLFFLHLLLLSFFHAIFFFFVTSSIRYSFVNGFFYCSLSLWLSITWIVHIWTKKKRPDKSKQKKKSKTDDICTCVCFRTGTFLIFLE